MNDSWQALYARKLSTPAEAIRKITPGQHIFIGSGAAEPACLVEALVRDGAHLADNEILHLLTLGPAPYVAPELSARFRHTAFFIGANVREAVQSGRADFMPVFLSEIPRLMAAGHVKIDVALIQVSPPDQRGYVSLGVSVDVVRAALESAELVIAQVNRNMPRTLGCSLVHVSRIDWLVPLDSPLFELRVAEPDAATTEIGRLVASLVPDGATLQAGIGRIPDATLAALGSRQDLGVHTEMLSDGFMNLAKAGVITGRRKTVRPGRLVTSFVMGSKELYEWVDRNAQVEVHPSDFTNDPFVISKNARMVAINSALSVDLTGQVAADTVQGRFFSGIGGQVDFIRGAARSVGGKPIIALPSTAQGGKVSRIVTALEAGAGVVTSRGDVHYVVTEYGIAQLWGKTVRERAAALVEVAHPDFRSDLLNEAKARHYVLPDQPSPNAPPRVPGRVERLTSGELVRIRPVRVSDERSLQDLLYRLSDESTFLRFFGRHATHPREEILSLVESDEACSIAYVAVLAETEELLGIARCDHNPRSRAAELGLTVADPWQGKGLGGLLLARLIDAAVASDVRSLTAEVLPSNLRMQRLLRRTGFLCSGQPGPDPLVFDLALEKELQSA